MLGIRIDNNDLDLVPGSKLQVEWVSTAMNESTDLLGSYSYPVTLAFSDRNNQALGYANLVENRIARKELQVIITAWGRPWSVAKMRYNLTPGGYDADLQIDNGEFARLIAEKQLADVFMKYAGSDFVDLDWIVVGSNSSEAYDRILDSCENVGKYPYVFFPIRNEDKFGGAAPDDAAQFALHDYINPWDRLGFFITSRGSSPDKKYYYNPSFYLTWVIQKVCTYLGFDATGEIFSDPEMLEKVIYNTGLIDIDTFCKPAGFKIAPGRHMPTIKINDFIKALRNAPFNLNIWFDGDTRKAWFNFKRSLLQTNEVIDISERVDPAKVTITRPATDQYQINPKIDDGDQLFKVFPYTASYLIGAGNQPTKIDIGIGTTNMRKVVNPDDNRSPIWRTPWVKQTANIYSDRLKDTSSYNDPDSLEDYSKNKFEFRILNYKGMVNDSLGHPYPYATSDELDPAEASLYTSTCKLGGEIGLLNKYCREWFNLLLLTERHVFTTHLPYSLLEMISPLSLIAYRTASKVLLPSIFDRVSFEESSSHQREIVCQFTIYPHYGVNAISSVTVTEFTEGPLSFEDPIFVKLIQENRHTSHGPIPSLKADHWADVVVCFYRDAAGTVPISVSNLKIFINEDYRGLNAKNYSTKKLEYICNGTKQTLMVDRHIYHYKYRLLGEDELVRYAYSLDTKVKNPGYTIIPTTWDI